jgi:hypothetical protein
VNDPVQETISLGPCFLPNVHPQYNVITKPAFPKSPDPALHQYLAQDRNAPTHGFCSNEHINSCAQMIQALPDPPQRILWNRRWKQKLRQRLSASELQQAPKKATLRT